MVNKWLKFNLNKIFQSPCVLCGDRGVDGRALCQACQYELPYSCLKDVCAGCALPIHTSVVTGGILYCGRCQNKPPLWSHCLSTFNYTEPVSWLVQALKFNEKLSFAPLLGGLMADTIAMQSHSKPELIIPVPLHRHRLRERGFNQALELARPIAKKLDIPLDFQSTCRLKATAEQSSLSASRRMDNVKGVFQYCGDNRVKHVAIVDDVMTTASTVHELSMTLKASGVEQIQIWVCARAIIGNNVG